MSEEKKTIALTLEKQTKFYNSANGTRGNCMVACYANYLGLRIDQCPAFEELFACQKPNGFWFQCVNLWFEGLGYELKQCKEESEIPADVEYYFAYGISERDVMHQVIYKSGQLYFDPHPSGSGILGVDGFEYLIKKQDHE